MAQEGQREPRCTSLLVCHAAHAHPGSSHALRGARSDGTIHNDPLAVFVLTGLFARRFWLGWERTRHTAAVGKQALFMGETPRYTWTKERVSVRRMCGRRSIPSFSYPIFVVPLRIDVCCSAATGTPCTACAGLEERQSQEPPASAVTRVAHVPSVLPRRPHRARMGIRLRGSHGISHLWRENGHVSVGYTSGARAGSSSAAPSVSLALRWRFPGVRMQRPLQRGWGHAHSPG